jgi:hypothetical protein
MDQLIAIDDPITGARVLGNLPELLTTMSAWSDPSRG